MLKLASIVIMSLLLSCTTSSNKLKGVATGPNEARPLMSGVPFPKAQVKNMKGEKVDLGSQLKGKKTVLVFYRGGWCPFCNRQLQGLRKIEKKLKKLGYQIVGISPDRPQKINESVKKQNLSYKLYSDDQVNAAKAFGLAFKVNDEMNEMLLGYGINLKDASGQEHLVLPVPAVYIIDENLNIHFSYANPNYKTRLKEKVILSAAKEYK